MRIYVHVLIILALITAGISPACAFISGQSDLVEICTSKGIEYKSVPAPDAPTQEKHHDKKQSDCSFCFNTAHGKSLKTDGVTIVLLSPSFIERAVLQPYALSQNTFYNPHAPRAPPTFL